MYEFVFLDLDDTILDFGKSEKEALQKVFLQHGVKLSPEMIARYSTINAEHWARLEIGELTREQVKFERFLQFIREYALPVDAEEIRQGYEEKLADEAFFFEGGEALLKCLYGKVRMFILSNGTKKVQDGRIRKIGIAPYFERIFVSEEIGYVKPQTELFDSCFREIPGFSKEKAILLGDSLSSDILGGKNAGIATCWFNPKGKVNKGDVIPDFEISSLEEFPSIVGIQ